MKMSNNPAKYEVLIKQYVNLDIIISYCASPVDRAYEVLERSVERKLFELLGLKFYDEVIAKRR